MHSLSYAIIIGHHDILRQKICALLGISIESRRRTYQHLLTHWNRGKLMLAYNGVHYLMKSRRNCIYHPNTSIVERSLFIEWVLHPAAHHIIFTMHVLFSRQTAER